MSEEKKMAEAESTEQTETDSSELLDSETEQVVGGLLPAV